MSTGQNAPPADVVRSVLSIAFGYDESGHHTQRVIDYEQERVANLPLRLPPDDLVQLWDKAKEQPESLTDDEKLRVLERWPKEEFNEQCREKCGYGISELLQKAVDHPGELTGMEANIILYGPKYGKYGMDDAPSFVRSRWPKELSAKRWDAQQIAETETERSARENARTAKDKASRVKNEAREQLTRDDRQNIVWCNKADWVQKLDQYPDRQWGFVLYRTDFGDDEAWGLFKQLFEQATEVALFHVKDSDRIRQRWMVQYIDDRELQNGSLIELAEDFRSRISSADSNKETIAANLRQDAFLVADSEVISSVIQNQPLPKRGFVKAVDATHTRASLESYQHGFTGYLKVAITCVMTTFFARLVPRGDPEDKPDETKRMMQSWDAMYYKARYDREEKIYPPTSVYNRGM